MSHYTLGWHDQLNEYHEIGEYAEDAFEAVKNAREDVPYLQVHPFSLIQLRRSNERSSYHINLCYIWNNNRNRLVLNTISMVTPLISMKQFNTWILDTTIYILDFLYRGRNFQRFWVLEVIARALFCIYQCVTFPRKSWTSR